MTANTVTQHQLGLERESASPSLSLLSTSGPPGAQFGFGVGRTSGIMVPDPVPTLLERTCNIPEMPVPTPSAVLFIDAESVSVERRAR